MIRRPFTIQIAPDRTIRGDVRLPDGPPPRSAVVIAHGFKGFKDWGFFPHVAEALAGEGHAAVSFNFSLNGISDDMESFGRLEDFARNTFTFELDELLLVLAEARGELVPRPVRKLGLLGHSRGGGISVLASAEAGSGEAGVDALVTWGGVATFDRWSGETKDEWRQEGRTYVMNSRTGQHMPLDVELLDDFERNRTRLDIEAAAGRVESPWLIVHGQGDTTVRAKDAHRLVEANPQARLELIPDAGHTFEASHPFKGTTASLDRAVGATVRHFRRYLLDADGEGS